MTTPPFWSAGILPGSRTTGGVVAELARVWRRRRVSRAWSAGQHGGVSSRMATTKSPSRVGVGAGQAMPCRDEPNGSSSQVGWGAGSRPSSPRSSRANSAPGETPEIARVTGVLPVHRRRASTRLGARRLGWPTATWGGRPPRPADGVGGVLSVRRRGLLDPTRATHPQHIPGRARVRPIWGEAGQGVRRDLPEQLPRFGEDRDQGGPGPGRMRQLLPRRQFPIRAASERDLLLAQEPVQVDSRGRTAPGNPHPQRRCPHGPGCCPSPRPQPTTGSRPIRSSDTTPCPARLHPSNITALRQESIRPGQDLIFTFLGPRSHPESMHASPAPAGRPQTPSSSWDR
jgi:hypothetical protein